MDEGSDRGATPIQSAVPKKLSPVHGSPSATKFARIFITGIAQFGKKLTAPRTCAKPRPKPNDLRGGSSALNARHRVAKIFLQRLLVNRSVVDTFHEVNEPYAAPDLIGARRVGFEQPNAGPEHVRRNDQVLAY